MNKNIIVIIGTCILTILIVLLFKNINDKKFYEVYEVSFNTYGGNIIESQYIKKNGKVKKPKNPIKKDDIFVEWTYLGKKYNFNHKVNKNMVLKAKYKNNNDYKEEISYVIKFDSDKGSVIDNQIIKENNKIIIPNNPIKEGYKFIGWYLNNKLYDFNTIVTNDINLVAKWEKEEVKKKYNVVFNTLGGSKIKNVIVEERDTIKRPINPTKEGYKFIGWTYKNKLYNFNTLVTSNVELVAIWEKIEIKEEQEEEKVPEEKPKEEEEKEPEEKPVINKYKVIFNSDGGTNIESVEVLDGNNIKKPNDPVKEGYTFNGWLLNGNKFDFNTKITSNITLEASWIRKVYKVKKVITEENIKLNVYLDNKLISFNEIKDIKGNLLCTGSNNIVSKDKEISTTVNIVLTDGKTVSGIVE